MISTHFQDESEDAIEKEDEVNFKSSLLPCDNLPETLQEKERMPE